MTPKKVLDELGIADSRVKFEDNKYVVDLKDSDEYARIYTTLDNLSDFEIADGETIMDTDNVQLKYDNKNLVEGEIGEVPGYMVTLIGNLDDNSYKLEIEEK